MRRLLSLNTATTTAMLSMRNRQARCNNTACASVRSINRPGEQLPVGNLKCVTSPVPIREGCVHILYLAPGTNLGVAVSGVAPIFRLNKDTICWQWLIRYFIALYRLHRFYGIAVMWPWILGMEVGAECRVFGNKSALMAWQKSRTC
jgi:hypothetical protein